MTCTFACAPGQAYDATQNRQETRMRRSNSREFFIAYPSRSLLKYAHTRSAPLFVIFSAHTSNSAGE